MVDHSFFGLFCYIFFIQIFIDFDKEGNNILKRRNIPNLDP